MKTADTRLGWASNPRFGSTETTVPQGPETLKKSAISASQSRALDNSNSKLRGANGRSTKIRTLDPRFPKPVLYQAELHSDFAPVR